MYHSGWLSHIQVCTSKLEVVLVLIVIIRSVSAT
jgi:hypothetical protein